MICHFPSTSPDQKAIHVRIEDTPSLNDRPDHIRVDMALNDKVVMRAAARPITDTEENDMLVLGKNDIRDVYTLGFREDGKAAFSIRLAKDNGALSEGITRIGECYGVAPYLKKWLSI